MQDTYPTIGECAKPRSERMIERFVPGLHPTIGKNISSVKVSRANTIPYK